MFSEAAVPCEAAKPESLNQNPHTALYIPIQPHTALYSPIQPHTALYIPIQPHIPPYIPQQRKLKRKKIMFFCERNNFFHKADVIVT